MGDLYHASVDALCGCEANLVPVADVSVGASVVSCSDDAVKVDESALLEVGWTEVCHMIPDGAVALATVR